MLFNEDTSDAQFQITAYDNQSVSVGNERFTRPVIVMPETIISDWSPPEFNQLKIDNFAELIKLQPETVLIGCGQLATLLPQGLRAAFESNNIGVECMTTPAACRCYMALLSEARNVAAALYIA